MALPSAGICKKALSAYRRCIVSGTVDTDEQGIGRPELSDYDVSKRKDGNWQAKREGADRASSVQPTQAGAQKNATDFAAGSGGGEVRIHGVDGKIRNSNTIGKPDPNPPKDTKH